MVAGEMSRYSPPSVSLLPVRSLEIAVSLPVSVHRGPLPLRGPHLFCCPFKKEEILLINKRLNLSAEPDCLPRRIPGKSGVLPGTPPTPSSI